jgi:hypothetical protein
MDDQMSVNSFPVEAHSYSLVIVSTTTPRRAEYRVWHGTTVWESEIALDKSSGEHYPLEIREGHREVWRG